MNDFSDRLAKALIEADYTKHPKKWYENKLLSDITSQLDQSRFSRESGIKTYTLNRHLQRKQNPHIDDLRTYAQKLSVSVDWLLGLSDVMERPQDGKKKNLPTKILSCADTEHEDLYRVMALATECTGFEQETLYLEHIKKIFCLASTQDHDKPIEDVNFLVKLFYLDYLFFLLIISSASSMIQSEFFRNNMQRNILILDYLFILLPHKLNNWIDPDLQVYVTQLLELEIRPNTRQSIENLFCITSLAFSWLYHVQSFSMILALKANGTEVVIDLINHMVKEQDLPIRSIRYNTTQDQEQLHQIRKQIRTLVNKRIG